MPLAVECELILQPLRRFGKRVRYEYHIAEKKNEEGPGDRALNDWQMRSSNCIVNHQTDLKESIHNIGTSCSSHA